MKKVFDVLALSGIAMSAPAFADGMKLPEFKKQPTPKAVPSLVKTFNLRT